jgi:hypothetical protein
MEVTLLPVDTIGLYGISCYSAFTEVLYFPLHLYGVMAQQETQFPLILEACYIILRSKMDTLDDGWVHHKISISTE